MRCNIMPITLRLRVLLQDLVLGSFDSRPRACFPLDCGGLYAISGLDPMVFYYETLAELAREVATTQQAAPAPAESGKFTARAEALLDAVDPANPRHRTPMRTNLRWRKWKPITRR